MMDIVSLRRIVQNDQKNKGAKAPLIALPLDNCARKIRQSLFAVFSATFQLDDEISASAIFFRINLMITSDFPHNNILLLMEGRLLPPLNIASFISFAMDYISSP